MKKTSTDNREFSIRPAEKSDADILADLGAKTFSDAYACTIPADDLNDYLQEAFSRRQMLDDITNPEVLLFLGVIAGKVCAYIKLQPTPPRRCIQGANPIELLRLYVLPDAKSRGIGTALLDVAFEAARKKGYKTCWLKVWDGNAGAIGFYDRKGFATVGNEPHPVANTSRNVSLMARPLE